MQIPARQPVAGTPPVTTDAARLLVVIVNFRTRQLTLDCLDGLYAGEETAFPALVVDNTPETAEQTSLNLALAERDWKSVSVWPLLENKGFAAGNNAAIRPALDSDSPPEYVLLLNPDTVPRKGAVSSLLEFMDAHIDVGIAGSRLEDPDGTPQISAFRFPSIGTELVWALRLGILSRMFPQWVIAPPVKDSAGPTDWVAGASMIVRRAVFEDIGLMDEAFFLYFEEVDFCRRARDAGWPCWYVPESRVVHLVGASSEISDARKHRKQRPRYWFDSRRRYFLKHHGFLYTALADAAWIKGFAFWRFRRWLQRKPDTDPPHLLGDFIRNSVWLRGGKFADG
ncbi:MAG: glycosyltransferase family 2 protein [Candidatus Hydrogenedentes bacterium]|nr:glycosyltransferase family 2 protein [Candidatus Hydrogenedentota bacterium]